MNASLACRARCCHRRLRHIVDAARSSAGCITKPNRESQHEHIAYLGGPGWKWTREQIIQSIDARTNFHVIDKQAVRKSASSIPGLNRRFDVVLAESLDRFSCDQEDTAGLFKRLTFAGVNIVTLAKGDITPPAHRIQVAR